MYVTVLAPGGPPTSNVRKFALAALYGAALYAVLSGPYRKMRFQQQRKVPIFRPSLPKSTFSYAPCVGATIAPSGR